MFPLPDCSAHWCEHPNLLAATSRNEDPIGKRYIYFLFFIYQERMVDVARWFISTLFASYHERCATGSEKKPYNPILGEQVSSLNSLYQVIFSSFAIGKMKRNKAGMKRTRLLNKVRRVLISCVLIHLVSHHPPITAFHIVCDKDKVDVTGHCGQKSKASMSCSLAGWSL